MGREMGEAPRLGYRFRIGEFGLVHPLLIRFYRDVLE